MKKASDILKEMAFNKNSKSSTQDAFLKNLQKHLLESTKGEVIPMPESKSVDQSKPAQLEFDFDSLKKSQLSIKKFV
ncbi:MAG: hypothetical protein HRT45_00500 [Bdellovibrionales bacterium]|nr:hypothetical protein [Bdellovibrionales bacterium]